MSQINVGAAIEAVAFDFEYTSYVKVFQICLAKLKNHSSETLSSHTTILTVYIYSAVDYVE